MARALEGIFVLNALFLVAGVPLLWGLRGVRDWGELVSLLGLAYVLGLVTVSVTATLVLIFGGGLSTGVVLGLVAGVAAVGIALGLRFHRSLPRGLGLSRPSPLTLTALVPAALTVVVLVFLYRVARSEPLTSWDAWAFWIPKAKAIYFYGGLDEHVFRTVANPSYPILRPALFAMDFRFMGSADTTTLAVQDWLVFAGYLAAAAALMRRLAPAVLVWLFLLGVTVIPEVDKRVFDRISDLTLGMFFTLAALALVRWLLTGERWLLAVFGILMAAMLATKRDGQMLALLLVIGGVAAAGWARRREWPWIVGSAAAAYAVNVPWRIWWQSRGLVADTPSKGLLHGTALTGRIVPSFRLVLGLMFDTRLWLPVAALAVAAAAVALTRRPRTVPVFFAVAFGLGIVGVSWVNWVEPTIPITRELGPNPTQRVVGSLLLLAIVMLPLLLAHALRRGEAEPQRRLANTTGSASASATNP